MIAAGHEDCDDVQRRRPYEPTILRDPCRLARVGPYRARWDRSLCRSFVRPPQRIILDMDDIDDPSRNSPCCAVTATTAPKPPRWCCREPCAATTTSASPGTIFARVETTPMGTDVRFIITNPRRRGRALYEKCSGPRENLIEDMERLDPVPACSRWQANQLPAHRYLLGCCARHRSVRAGWSHLRDDQAHVGEDRRPRRANDRCGARRGKPSLQPQNAFRLSPRGSARRARPTTMAGGRGGGLCRTGGSPRFQGLPVEPMMILDTTDGLSASYRSCRSIGYKSSIRAITSFRPCRHGYGRVDRRPFSLLPRRRLPS
jgi:hypothetical protein